MGHCFLRWNALHLRVDSDLRPNMAKQSRYLVSTLSGLPFITCCNSHSLCGPRWNIASTTLFLTPFTKDKRCTVFIFLKSQLWGFCYSSWRRRFLSSRFFFLLWFCHLGVTWKLAWSLVTLFSLHEKDCEGWALKLNSNSFFSLSTWHLESTQESNGVFGFVK